MKTPETPKEQFNWHKEVGGVGPDKKEARTKFYSKLGRLALQVKTDAEKAEALNKLKEKGLTTLSDLKNKPQFQEKIKKGSRFSLMLDRYFKDAVGITDKSKRAQEVRLTLSLLTEQGLNVDSFDIGSYINIIDGILYIIKGESYDRTYNLRYPDTDKRISPTPLDLGVFESKSSKESTAPLLYSPGKPAVAPMPASAPAPKPAPAPAAAPKIVPERVKYEPQAPEKPKSLKEKIIGSEVPNLE